MEDLDELFKEYEEKTGGHEPIGYIVPFGYSDGVEEHGGIESVYKECIQKGITWEKLLDWNPPEDAVI